MAEYEMWFEVWNMKFEIRSFKYVIQKTLREHLKLCDFEVLTKFDGRFHAFASDHMSFMRSSVAVHFSHLSKTHLITHFWDRKTTPNLLPMLTENIRLHSLIYVRSFCRNSTHTEINRSQNKCLKRKTTVWWTTRLLLCFLSFLARKTLN